MGDLGFVLGNYAYAEFPRGTGGSAVPDWPTVSHMRTVGFKRAVKIVVPDLGNLDQHREDVRRAKVEVQLDRLDIRLADWGALDSPDEDFAQCEPFLDYVVQIFGPGVIALDVNEPKLDRPGVTMADCLAHTKRMKELGDAHWGPGVVLWASPTVNPYQAGNEEDVKAIREHPECYDVYSANIYPHNADELVASVPWSLGWHVAGCPSKDGKRLPIVVWEYNGHPSQPDGSFTMTRAERNVLLPKLHYQMLQAPILAAYWFIVASDDPRFQELVITWTQTSDAQEIILGAVPDMPPDDPNPPPGTDPLAGAWVLEIGGLSIPFTLRRPQ